MMLRQGLSMLTCWHYSKVAVVDVGVATIRAAIIKRHSQCYLRMNSCFERHPQNCGTRARKCGRSIRNTWTLDQYNNKKYMPTPHQCVSDANSGGVQVSGMMFASEGGPETGVNNKYTWRGQNERSVRSHV